MIIILTESGNLTDMSTISGVLSTEKSIRGSIRKSNNVIGNLSDNQSVQGSVSKIQKSFGTLSSSGTLVGTLNSPTVDIIHYDGSYDVVPKTYEQVLNTKNKYMDKDVTVLEIPYFEEKSSVINKCELIGKKK